MTESELKTDMVITDDPQEKIHIKDYDDTEAALANMGEALNKENIPSKDDENGYQLIEHNVKGGKALIKLVEEKRVELRAPWKAHGQAIQDEAGRITQEIKEAIEPWVEAKKEVDDAEKERLRVNREAKAKRVNDIRDSIDQIQRSVICASGKKAVDINEFIEELIDMDVEDGSFEEFTDEAIMEKQIALEKLTKMYEDANAFEDSQAKAIEDRKKLDEERAEFEAKKEIEEEKQRLKDERDLIEKNKKLHSEEITKEIEAMKDFVLEVMECRTSEGMVNVIGIFKTITLNKEAFDDQLATATQEHGIILGKLEGILSSKIKAEQSASLIEEENKRLREAEQKRIDEESAQKQKEFEAQQEKERLAQLEADKAADIERNGILRNEALAEMIMATANCPAGTADLIIGFLEQGMVPHVSVQWNPEVLQKEST